MAHVRQYYHTFLLLYNIIQEIWIALEQTTTAKKKYMHDMSPFNPFVYTDAQDKSSILQSDSLDIRK